MTADRISVVPLAPILPLFWPPLPGLCIPPTVPSACLHADRLAPGLLGGLLVQCGSLAVLCHLLKPPKARLTARTRVPGVQWVLFLRNFYSGHPSYFSSVYQACFQSHCKADASSQEEALFPHQIFQELAVLLICLHIKTILNFAYLQFWHTLQSGHCQPARFIGVTCISRHIPW